MAIRTPAHILQPAIVLLGALACVLLGRSGTGYSAGPVTPTQIAQVPLTVAVPAHPQVVLAIGNSESMDGNLSGAIMTGAGSLPASMNLLQNSNYYSPVNYTIPTGFTPPVDPGDGVVAPYTVNSGGHWVDNSPSRLNVAKGGILAMLNTYMAYADFALIDYKLSGTGVYTTWVYEMSPPTGFVFTSSPVAPNRYIDNPCYQYDTLLPTNTVYIACHNIDTSGHVTGNMAASTLMQIDATIFPAGGTYNGGSSDDPLINDVLYAGGLAPVCLVYGGPNPGNPYTHFTLAQYNANPGNIHESYTNTVNGCAPTTFPTNAGFVPYTPQTMYIERGWGYYGNQDHNDANVAVPMTTAGAVPTGASVNAALAQFTPFLQPETNSPGTTEIKAAGGQSALPGLLIQSLTLFNSNPPSSNGCNPTRYVILLTDGMPTLDKNGRSWPPPGTVSAAGWHMTVAFKPDGSLNLVGTNDQAVIDTVNQLGALLHSTSHVKTYVIGLGAGVDPSVNPVAAKVLTAFAIAGGTGSYFPATDPTSLANDLQAILAQIQATTQSTAATAVNSTGLHMGSVAYLAQFTTSDTYLDWTGNMNAWPIDPVTGFVNTTAGTQLWSAETQLDLQDWDTGRLIATWDPVAHAGTPFRWNPGLAPAGISATTGLGMALQTFIPDPNGQDVLNFLRGSALGEQRNGGQFRNRTHKLGDIVASAPLYVGPPNGLAQTADYFSFAVANQNRTNVIYVGANDGMLHALKATTGDEMFAYIPNGVYNNLIKLVNPFYNAQHLFYVNGSPRSADVKFSSDGSWHTVLVSPLGAGGNSVFALDISAPDSIVSGGEAALAQAVLWEFTDSDMGLSFSEPAIVNTSGGYMVFFGNGYNSPNQKPVLYAIEPQHGTMLGKIDLCAAVAGVCNMGLANGLSSVAVVNSYGQVSAPANTVYAGDLQGNLWRVDITNSNPANWLVSVIYQARDGLNNIQPITTAPTVTLNPEFPQLLGTMVFVGTGQFLGVGDLSTSGVQSMYGVFDPPTGSSPPLGFTGIPTRANLVQQLLANDLTSLGVQVRVIPTVQPVTLPQPNRGWFMDLNLVSGERIITDPEIESGGGVVFTTYQPNTSSCLGGGSAWLMVLNYATGGAFPLPELDTNSDGKLDGTDVGSTGNNPVGMSLGPVYASAVTFLPSGGGPGGTMKLTSVSSNNVDSILDRGRAKQRISWWEIRH
ncbi:MAG TPA: PilC/PilY family type IV pilus protein [Steroidobacteraceae bacterium]|nr:PilC/PilY family type IV pilus protein [Steroidobacteraceae bacterium]